MRWYGGKKGSYHLGILMMNEIVLKTATIEDTLQVYVWQCLPETRRYANNPEVPTWEHHQAWMLKKLESQYDFFYMVYKGGLRVGVVRLDFCSSNRFLLSIFMCPKYHGQGLAKRTLAAIDMMHPDIEINARVLEANVASQALFKAAGYNKEKRNLFTKNKIEK